LALFPGVEITVGQAAGRVHVLAVLDPRTAVGNTVTALLGACGIANGFGDDQVTSTTRSFEDVITAIRQNGGIAIPAHIDGPQGLLNGVRTLNPEGERSLKSVFAAEFCDPSAFAQADGRLKAAVGRLAVLAGSDAHLPDEIGRHATWVKMSRPSIEGLRLALMDHDFCVKNQDADPNAAPDVFLRSLTIAGMQHCGRIPGQPLRVPLHPHFTALIGGRGTGKSTALESVRIAARRERDIDETSRLREELDRFMSPASSKGVMLADTEILLEIHRRGKDYRLRWRFDGTGAVLEEDDVFGWGTCEVGDLRERFPLSIYSQKQINELASNPKGLLAVLDRSPAVNRAEWEGRWNTTRSQFLQLRERQREINRQLAQEPQVKARLEDVVNDLKQYEEKGHGTILKNYQRASQQFRAMPLEETFGDLAARIRELGGTVGADDFPAMQFPDEDPATLGVRKVHAESATALAEVQKELEALAAKVEQITADRKAKLMGTQWYALVCQAYAAYKALAKEYEGKSSPLDLNVYGQWVQQRGQLHQEMAGMQALRKEAKTVEGQIDQAYGTLLGLRNELAGRRRRFIQSVIGTDPHVRMELVPFGDVSSIEAEYRSLLGLEEDSFRTSILDREAKQGLLWELCSWEDATKSDIAALVRGVKETTAGLCSASATSAGSAVKDARLLSKLQRDFERQPADLDQLWCWWPDDRLRVKYVREQEIEDLDKGSAGQKAAAILAFLLSHGDEPLIVDQPEDDLDNALIYDLVVQQIHLNKSRRQLVIVTHNANIVVNGDAELVHVLRFAGGQVQLAESGGLEEERIRSAICDIMEGGRQAFEKRYKRMTLEV
jgi:predicted ATPase